MHMIPRKQKRQHSECRPSLPMKRYNLIDVGNALRCEGKSKSYMVGPKQLSSGCATIDPGKRLSGIRLSLPIVCTDCDN